MNKSHYTQIRHFTYYALILLEDEKYVYVGKTSERALSNTFSRHVCGRVAATNGFFGKESVPKLYLLEECDETTAQGYKRVVAYVHLFQEEGYFCLNHARTIRHAKNPKDETKELIAQLKSKTLDEILKGAEVEQISQFRATTEEEQSEQVEIHIPKKKHEEQLNIRTDPITKEHFLDFCSRLGVNQRQGFELLLDHAKDIEQSNTFQLLMEYQRKIEQLKKENKNLSIKNSKLKETQTPSTELWARKYLGFLKNGISIYLDAVLKSEETRPPLRRYSYNAYRDRFFEGASCSYPEREGFYEATLEAVLWSNSGTKACFLVFKDTDGVQRKLRYYPKSHYIGRSFLDDKYAFEDAQWVLGALRSKDGALELVAGFPLVQKEFTEKKHNEKPTLATQIALAQKKKNR